MNYHTILPSLPTDQLKLNAINVTTYINSYFKVILAFYHPISSQ